MTREEIRLQRLFDEEIRKRNRNQNRPETRTHHLKCPKCGAYAFNLWMIHGLTYFKCGACEHKTGNL